MTRTPRDRTRPVAAAVLLALLAAFLPLGGTTPAAAAEGDLLTGQCPGAVPAGNTSVTTKDPSYGSSDRIIDLANIGAALAWDIGAVIGAMIVDEAQKAQRVETFVGDVQDCFPGYNVMVTQPKGLTTQHMKGMLLAKTVSISSTSYRVLVFKEGAFHKDGDLGYKNWGYSGYFSRTDENRTVTFTAPPRVTRKNDWYASSVGEETPMSCEVNGVTAPDADLQLAVGDGSDENRARADEKLLARAMHCWPSHNILLLHDGGAAKFTGTDSLRMADGKPAYKKKFDIGNRTFWLYVTDTGKVTSTGDGGWLNWGYGGHYQRTEKDGDVTVDFTRPAEADLNPSGPWTGATTDLALPDAAHYVCAGPPPDGDGTFAQRAAARLAVCYPGTNILVVKSLNDMQFARAEGLRHVWEGSDGHTGYDAFVLRSGDVLNTGDGGYTNWAFSGWYERPEGQDGYVSFSAPPGDGGQDPRVPELGSRPATFTVRSGSSSFDVSQPADSLATYVLKDGRQPRMTLSAADGAKLKYTMDDFDVSAQGRQPTATVTVDTAKTHQKIDGFGGAMTDSAASLIAASPHQDAILSQLFGTGDEQAGLTLVRSPMGSSDLMANGTDVHTYEDTKGSFSADATPADKRQIAMLQAAKRETGGDFKLLGTPWSAPAWAKRGGKLLGAECGTEQNELDRGKVNDYADYFAEYVSAYDKAGIRPWMVSMQNEPENCKTQMPTTLLNPDDEVALSKALKSRLPGDVGVLGFDHNWNDPDYVRTLTGQGKVDAIGYHCYDGTHYGAQTRSVKTLMTECSGFVDQSSDVAGNMGWEVANLLIGPLRNGSTGSVYWSLAQDAEGGPALSTPDACHTCRGMMTVGSDGSYTPSQDLWFWGQFGKFVRPGAVRVDSTNTGDLSTVAFRDGDTTTLVVLNSRTHADGGAPGSSESDFRGKIVQYKDDGNAQKTSWLVGADGYRRWVSDLDTYSCLTDEAGKPDAGGQPGGTLDKYVNLKDVWAVCGASVMGTNSELETGTYLKSGGGARLTLGKDGKLVAKDASGTVRWTAPATGDRLVLQEDGNLVLYDGPSARWASGTDGKGAAWLSLRDDGTFILSTKADKTVWTSPVDAAAYRGQIVQWDGDKAEQKTSWQVGHDGKRRVVHDWDTFKCLHDAGEGDSRSVSSDTLDRLPDLTGVWATCGADRVGAQGSLEKGAYLKAGDYTLEMQTDGNLVEYGGGKAVWSTGTKGKGTVQLTLQSDGNLVAYADDGHAVWASGTKGKRPGWLVLGDDGSLRLYDADGKQIWTR
ncbi:hypothetical protein ACFY1V_06830 [Streptomyces sp. NPDC001255]|uniref:hypothetical protein n=1 Tax=Streptomyces sp. NPDC001255 TaxID=3364550 RepID=UPI0036911F1D